MTYSNFIKHIINQPTNLQPNEFWELKISNIDTFFYKIKGEEMFIFVDNMTLSS